MNLPAKGPIASEMGGLNFPFDRDPSLPFTLCMIDTFLHSPLAHVLALGTSIVFTAIAAAVPPNAGNLVAAIFLSTFGSFLGGEEDENFYEKEIADADI